MRQNEMPKMRLLAIGLEDILHLEAGHRVRNVALALQFFGFREHKGGFM